jgi:hypothetical protein
MLVYVRRIYLRVQSLRSKKVRQRRGRSKLPERNLLVGVLELCADSHDVLACNFLDI